MENWQSEFLQFSFFIAATIWLVQKGSAESKKLDAVGLQTDEEQRVGEHAPQRSPARARARTGAMQNWQSEFLAVGTMAAFTIYLRQRGSPESKSVGAPHDETGSSV